MKVLVVTSAFPRWPGDSRGPSLIQQAQSLQKQGAGVLVLTLHHPGTPRHEVFDGVEVVRLRYMIPERLEMLQAEGGGLPAIWKKKPLARLLFIPMFLSLVFGIMRYGRQVDVIHTHWTLIAAAAWLGKFYHRRPIAVTIHGSEIYVIGSTPLGRWFNRFFLSRTNRVAAVSRALLEAALAQGVPPSKIELVPDAVDVVKFHPPEGDHEALILYVGSLIPRKGVNYLFEALGRVLPDYPAYRAAVIGYGPEEAPLKAQAARLGISGQVDFIPTQSQLEIASWMRRAKLFVLPSLEEALGIVLLEAQASGTPVIASRVGGIPEWVSPHSGILVPPGDAGALEAALRTLLDETTWQQFSQQARRWAVENFLSWDDIAAMLMRIFHEISSRT
jgi:glycosyltransferase involved in cell wall biosynthesis